MVGLAESHGVRYATLQLRGPDREWWRTYSGTLPFGSPLTILEKFFIVFHVRFIPWSVREDICLRFENLRHDILFVKEYEMHFFQLFRHALAIIPNETEGVHIFLNYLLSLSDRLFLENLEKGLFSVHCKHLKRGEIDGERGV